MKTNVSRVTAAGGKPCSKCGREPRRPGQSWGNNCFAEYNRHQRAMARLEREAGLIKVTVTPEEWELIQAARLQPAGKHHAPVS